MIKVSILIPVYNVATYIERCAVSVFNQTLSGIEFIFVNDASQDNSVQILNNLKKDYPHLSIKIIHHTRNEGLATTRKTAFFESSGKYILTVDSDDYIESDMAESMYIKAEEEGADIVVSDFYIEELDRTRIFKDYVSNNEDKLFLNILKDEKSSPSLCNKLIKRELFDKIDYHLPIELNYYEDRYLTAKLFYFAKKVVKIDKPFYHYIQYNFSSITKSFNSKHFEDVISYWELMDSFLKEKGLSEKYKNEIEIVKIKNKANLMIQTKSPSLRKQYADLFLNEEKKHIHSLDFLRLGERLILFLLRKRMFWLSQLVNILLEIKFSIKKRICKQETYE